MKRILWMVCLLLSMQSQAQRTATLSSPDRAFRLTVATNAQGQLTYQLSYKNKPVIQPSTLGFSLSKPAMTLSRFAITGIDSSRHDETWKPVWGEVSQIRDHHHELAVTVRSQTTTPVDMLVRFRLFNDGLGFRYEFPKQANLSHFVVAEELTQFALTGDHKTFWIPGDYDTNEYLYNTTPISQIDALAAAKREKDIALQSLAGPDVIQTPLLMKTAQGVWISLHEAALLNYPVMLLKVDKAKFRLQSTLVPDAVGNKAYLQTPAQTPWRTLVISDKAADLPASKLILNLNAPPAFSDVSWIKPQKFIGVWWEMHTGKGTWEKAGGKHAANTANVKKYIDFAAKNGFDGVLVEGWNQGWEDWFGNWKENVFDFVSPYDDYNMDELTAYAQRQGVRLIMHHETSGAVTNYERRMDRAYQYMVDKGINTVKTGYVGRIIPRGEHHDGQWMVNHYQWVAAKAAEYKLMVDSHESARPTGLHRTYPNWMASEAARGNEFNNAPTLGLVPEHETILPFTRLMGGPMDYTPGFFRFKLNQFEPTRKQEIRTTLAKQLADYVTMYSPLQMAGDLPENYEPHLDALQFIRDVPVDWDDTRILAAEPGDYITIARKAKGKPNWFVGAVTDENSRTQSVALSFLEPGQSYDATIYRDADNADWKTNPAAYVVEKMPVNSQTTLTLKLAKGGGCAISILKR